MFQQFVLGHHAVPVVDEVKKKVEGPLAQRNRLLLPLNGPPETVNRVIVEADRFYCFQGHKGIETELIVLCDGDEAFSCRPWDNSGHGKESPSKSGFWSEAYQDSDEKRR